MPVRESIDTGFTQYRRPDPLPKPPVFADEALGAAWRLENDVYNAWEVLTTPQFPEDPSFKLVDKLKSTRYWDDYRDNFLGVKSESEFNHLAGKIDKQERDREVLERSGWPGVVAMGGAGLISPLVLMPFMGPARGAKGVAQAAGLGFAAGALQELPLAANQPTRTAAEIGFSVATSTVLNGILGGAVLALRAGEREALEAGLAFPNGEKTISSPQAAGAQVSAVDPGKLAPGGKTIAKIVDSNPLTRNPITYNIEGRSFEARRQMAMLDDSGVLLEGAAKGIPPSEGGTVIQLIKQHNGRLTDFVQKSDDVYQRYMFDDTPPDILPSVRATMRGYTDKGKMSRPDFEKAVFEAAYSGDTHPNKYVQEAAQLGRKTVLDPTLKALQEAKLLGEEIKPGVDTTYISWLPDHEAITANPVGFVDFLEQKYTKKLQDDFLAMMEKFKVRKAKSDQLLEDVQLPADEIERLRDEFGAQLKGLEESANAQQLNALEDTIANLRAQARQLKGGNLQDDLMRKQMLQDAKDMEESAGPSLKDLKGSRRELKTRLSNLNKAVVVLEERLAKKLEKIDRAEELSMAALNRAARAGQRFLNKMDDWSDEVLDKELSALQTQFAKIAKIYDNGEERLAKLTDNEAELNRLNAGVAFGKDGKVLEVGGGEIPAKGLVVANQYENGKVYIGKPGDLHFSVNERYPHAERGDPTFTGFINPEGKLLDRTEALTWAEQNEKKIKSASNMPKGELDAADYREQIDPLYKRRQEYDILQQKRADKLTDLSEKIADAEDLGRDTLRDMINDMLQASLERVNKINNRRAVRTAKLRDQAAKLSPEMVQERVAGIRTKMDDAKVKLEERAKAMGADSVDVSQGSVDFKRYAREAAFKTKDKFLATNIRLPVVDMMQSERGAELPRLLGFIPTDEMKPWLNQNYSEVLRHHVRTMAPDIEIARKFGSVNNEEGFLKLTEELNAKLESVSKAVDKKGEPRSAEWKRKESEKVQADYKLYAANLEMQIRRLRNQQGLPKNPDGIGTRMAKTVMDLNVLRFMGQVVVSSLADPARIVARNGFTRTFKHAVVPLVTNLKGLGMIKHEAQIAGTAVDVALHSHTMALTDLVDDIQRGTKFERATHAMSRKMGVVAGFSYYTDGMKTLAASVSNARILAGIGELVTKEKVSPKTISYLTQNGVTGQLAERIWKQVQANGGAKVNGVWLPNTEDWTDDVATSAFRAAVTREVDNTIITPGLEKPGWTDASTTGRMLSQFKSFGFASTSKTLIAGLQQRDMAFANGVLSALALGALSYYTYAVVRGGDTYEKMMNAELDEWADQAFDRSGLSGVFGMGRDILSRIPATAPYVSFSGGRTTRRGGDNLVEALAGPSFDFMKTSADVVTALHDPIKSTGHDLRTLLPLQNTLFISRIFDAIEEAVNLKENRK